MFCWAYLSFLPLFALLVVKAILVDNDISSLYLKNYIFANVGVLVLIDSAHDAAKGVDVFDELLNLRTDLLEVVCHVLEQGFGLLVKVFTCDRELLLRGVGPSGTSSRDWSGMAR